MAKILITSLGTGQKDKGGYLKADYRIENKIYLDESLIARCYCEHYQIDKVLIVGTAKSAWDDLLCRYSSGSECDDDVLDLYNKKITGIEQSDLNVVERQMDRHLGKTGSRCFLIEYGIDETQLLSNFTLFLGLAEHIAAGDEIYLDITHSFRSLALMSYVMLTYLLELKHSEIKVSKILYAMFEWKYEPQFKLDPYIPVVDLSILFRITNWIKAISDFKNFGNAHALADLTQDGFPRLISNSLHNLADSLSLNQLEAIRKNLHDLSHNSILIAEMKKHPFTLPLIPDIKALLSKFRTKTLSLFQYDLASWYFENKSYGLSYLCLAEAIITHVCEHEGLNLFAKDDREQAKKNLLSGYPRLHGVYDQIAFIRNSIAHSIPAKKHDTVVLVSTLSGFISSLKQDFV